MDDDAVYAVANAISDLEERLESINNNLAAIAQNLKALNKPPAPIHAEYRQ